MEAVLLLALAAGAAHHLLVLELAGLHVYVLLERVEVEQGEDLVAGVVGPVGGEDLLLHRAGVPENCQKKYYGNTKCIENCLH